MKNIFQEQDINQFIKAKWGFFNCEMKWSTG